MTIKPIRNESDYENALAEIDSFGDPHEGTEEFAVLDALVTLVVAYEAKQYPMGLPDPISAIEFALERRSLTRKDLENSIGSSGRISEIMNRQRALTMAMIRKLHVELGIGLDILIQDYPLAGRREGKMASSDVEDGPQGGRSSREGETHTVVIHKPTPNPSAPRLGIPDGVQETTYFNPFDQGKKVGS